jgi:Tfp pilus assembly protein PilO
MFSGRWDRQRVILTAAFLAIEIFLCGYLILYTNSVKSEKSAQLATAKQELATLRNDAGQLTGLRKEYTLSKQTIAHLEPGFAPDKKATYLPTLLSQLQDLADATHVKLDAYAPQVKQNPVAPPPSTTPSGATTPTAGAAAPAEETLPITVRLVGTFPNLLNFINRLKSFPKVISIDAMQLRPEQNGMNLSALSPNLVIQMSVTATLLPLLPGVGS